jgi:hypothetical protein
MPSDRASATRLVRKFNIATAKNGGAERSVTVCLFVQPLWPVSTQQKGANFHPPLSRLSIL